MKRALITGINGFTGRYMAHELQQAGWEVWGMGSETTSTVTEHYRQANLVDAITLTEVVAEIRPHVVVHLAGVAFVAHSDASAFYQVHILGTRNLLAAIAASGQPPDCLLLASSATVYGNSTEGVFSEASPLHPANDYAVSKLAMEYMARTWMDQLPIVIARPFNYTGVGQSASFLLPKIVDTFRRQAPLIELGNLDVSRDFSDVRAVATAYRRLLEVCPPGETVNVCSGQATSLQTVLALAQDITGQTIEVRVNPAFVRTNEIKLLCGDATKLRAIIGQWSTPALPETLQWMLQA